MQRRLDDLEEGIERSRDQAEDDDLLPSDEPEPTFRDPNPNYDDPHNTTGAGPGG